MPNQTEIDKLRQRAVKASDAFRCCVRGRNRATRLFDGLADAIELGLTLPEGGEALTPGGEWRVTRFIQTPSSPSQLVFELLVGAAFQLVGKMVYEGYSTQTQTASEAAAIIRGTSVKVRNTTADDCFDCVKDHELSQDNARKRVTAEGTGGYLNKMMIRVPHE